jgi:hypothetical protein
MCLLCEAMWMAFEPPPGAEARKFVADAPEPAPDKPPPTPPGADESADGETR